ncbi:uncharacterized protein LOC111915550 [Lactuca sativa]|uniref:PB1 domain-containing protein n=1 Tax=Lactuca sativa TaxID=4236 RepID=A0A9R1ULI1_LACSA|nr:uncharacterized protein LOC111915550 [Lactuca sativa]KAJ0189026.1 hypothetical protein LSAT_V11C800445980 [Lactuca sativa]
MDPPPPTTALHHHYQDSLESSSVSSPTSRHWDETLPPPKLRMMCSFGGHIIPRPHDKSLCYMGGETRIVVADRHTSLADLCCRLSTTLLNGRQFSLKYQLPSEDLDSLVSVSTDEDLDNMVEEYDRLNASNPSTKPARLRLFLFLSKPETAASMGSLLDDAKSETWFVDALNGAGLLPRGLSDSATIDNLLEHKDGTTQEDRDNYTESEIQRRRLDVQLNLPDSPLVETTSSFGSSSSSPSMSNLPPIKVRVDQMNQMAGLDEQLSQLNVNVLPPPVPVNNVSGWAAVVSSAGGGTTVSDDERSDHGAPGGGMRKPPLPLQPVQRKFGHDAYNLPSPDSKHGGAYGLHSPDSIASDSSIASANCHSKSTFTQDPNPSLTRDTGTPPATTQQVYPTTTAATMSTMNYQIPIQQIPDYADTQPPPPPQQQLNQDQQQQFYQTRPHYIHNQPPPPGSSYYPVYAPPPQMDHQQYPLYFLPVSQNHQYGMQMQSNPPDAATNPTAIPSSAAVPPLYPTKTAVQMSTTPGMIQIPSNQFQQQYVNVSHHPPTPLPNSSGGKYGYEYAHPTQDQVYYSNHHSVAAPLPSQYQTMSPASAMLLTQVSPPQQPASESAKQ